MITPLREPQKTSGGQRVDIGLVVGTDGAELGDGYSVDGNDESLTGTRPSYLPGQISTEFTNAEPR